MQRAEKVSEVASGLVTMDLAVSAMPQNHKAVEVRSTVLWVSLYTYHNITVYCRAAD